MVTAATLRKEHFFHDTSRRRMLHDLLLELGEKYGWQLEAWAVFSNHYHWIGEAPTAATTLKKFISHLHTASARAINAMDRVTGRKVWFQYWDTCLTNERSYLVRLNYVHNNAVHHKLVDTAEQYEFCSARWFAANGDAAFRHKVASFRYDRLNVPDGF
jgi:putative transposase